MLICPKCKCEYREGFKVCTDCGVELVETTQDESFIDTNEDNAAKEDEWIFLINIAEGYERDSITSLLESNHIPFLEKQKGMGQFNKIYTGLNYYGTDVYVPKSQLEKAKELIEFVKINSQDIEVEEDELLYEKRFSKKKTVFRWYLISFFIIPIFIALFLLLLRVVFMLLE